ncbi:MAG: Ribosome maturation factor RimM [Candidatus Erwinia impunctatus]|nr:Ribosome maturation factor RimM [Culicoides impunctatus]
MSKQAEVRAPENPLIIGKMGAAYGIRGWLKVFSSTEIAESIFDYQPWFIQRAGKWQHIELESWKRHNQDMIIKVNNIDDRDTATLLTNCEIVVDAMQLPELEGDDYYWKDLIGCQVLTLQGYDLGQVTELMETGSNDVLVVKANLKDAFGAQERLIPFLDGQVISNVDLPTGKIIVDWDPGF